MPISPKEVGRRRETFSHRIVAALERTTTYIDKELESESPRKQEYRFRVDLWSDDLDDNQRIFAKKLIEKLIRAYRTAGWSYVKMTQVTTPHIQSGTLILRP